ncbi:ScbR family autoregulator-binding transcription factor [Streptomyces misionensis]|uniref:ScbR family autoregulator-binding transcription factor n=1 Tax=Streptomyces misionensis TaxID=67331 RepID=UPI0033A1FE17
MGTDDTVAGSRRTAAAAVRGRPRQERALRTRELVLQAAARAFADGGFPDVTVLDIAEYAGMTKGAVYFHYSGKEDLAAAVSQGFYAKLRELAETTEALGLPPRERVVEFLMRTAVAFRDDVVIQAGARLQIEHSQIGSALPVPYREYTDILARWLLEDTRDGRPPQALARVLVSAVFGAQHISWILDGRADIVERIEEIVAATLTG